ncbi:CSC1-like protein HYP1 isoform X1 [Coffea arabica]|uniref:CSC1-like protein HYP1 isoform X1 n=1 Tax=Coffea arabica TaxID=13443 RepID=A0A6P6V5L8_COFAR
MLVSALLTSVGINFGLCVLFWTLYSSLRKQPANYHVYAPRLLSDGQSQGSSTFRLERLLPTPDWVRRAWQSSEEELLSSSGLDAVVFMRIITFSLRVITLAVVIGVFILLPVNFSGDQLHDVNFANLTSSSLDIFTVSNVKDGSNRLWAHFCAVYLLTIFVCFLLYHEYKYVSSRRISYFLSSKPQPHQFTILVRSVPVSAGITVSDSVERFFKEYHPSTYLSHVVVRRTNKLRYLINDTKKLYKRLIHLQREPTASKSQPGSFFGLFEAKDDLVDHYEKKLEDLEENVRLVQSDVSMAGEEVRAAFVSFKSRYGAAAALHIQQADNPTQMVAEQAPEPHDVYWPLFPESFMRRWISQLIVIVACILLTALFLIPVVVVQGLTNLSQLEIWLPFLKSILNVAFVSQVVTGYLPSLILQLFLMMIPPIMKFLSSVQGHISISEIIKSACNKVLWFTIWNIYFANVLSGSVFSQIFIFLEPKNVPARLAVAVPAQASFFIAYVVTSGWTSTTSELFRLIPLICSLIRKCFSGNTNNELKDPAFPYHGVLPRVLFFGLLGITYFFLAPLILPFLLVYFCLAYTIYSNQFINVYAPLYETAGKFWPIVHNSMIFSLLLMHAIAVGIFTLKKLPLASSLVFPLPVITLIFNAYCRKRFLPIFVAYSAETLIKKDREDINDATTAEFFNKLVAAYQDPALLPMQYSSDSNRERTSLLSPV